MPLGCIGCTSFGKTFVALARPGLAFAKLFGIGLAADRFAAFPRADLEVLRDLPRIAAFLVRNVARLFCRAMFAPYAVRPKRAQSPVLVRPGKKQACAARSAFWPLTIGIYTYYANLR
jgi:hypothetical protein